MQSSMGVNTERTKIYDSMGRFKGHAEKSEAIRKGLWHRAAELVIINLADEQSPNLVFQKEPPTNS
jgi:hypothetical protein